MTSYYKGIYVGHRLVAHHQKFKKIGNNLFVLIRTGAQKTVTLEGDPRAVTELMGKNQKMTVGDLVKAACKSDYRKATEAEHREYLKADERLQKAYQKELEASEKRKRAAADRAILEAINVLRRHRVITGPGNDLSFQLDKRLEAKVPELMPKIAG